MNTAKTNIDPTTVATVWHSMQTICKEMRHLVKRTAQNYLIGQLQDMSVGIWGADGTTIAVPVGLPTQFLGTTFRHPGPGQDVRRRHQSRRRVPDQRSLSRRTQLPSAGLGLYPADLLQGRAAVLHALPRPSDGHRRVVPRRLLPERLRHPRRGAHHSADQGHRSRPRAERPRQSDPQQCALRRTACASTCTP